MPGYPLLKGRALRASLGPVPARYAESFNIKIDCNNDIGIMYLRSQDKICYLKNKDKAYQLSKEDYDFIINKVEEE